MYTNESTSDEYPKTLLIRNTEGGMIWQRYHVKKESEAVKLSKNATRNGFMSIVLVDYEYSAEETFPDWRVTCSPDIIA